MRRLRGLGRLQQSLQRGAFDGAVARERVVDVREYATHAGERRARAAERGQPSARNRRLLLAWRPTAAALRANEVNAEVVMKATNVDGSYSADPKLDPTATRFDHISFQDVLEKGLKVMDAPAIALCMDNKLPILVFDMNKPGNLVAAVMGEPVGTLVN